MNTKQAILCKRICRFVIELCSDHMYPVIGQPCANVTKFQISFRHPYNLF